MYQIAARVWNQIAETQPLQTEWAQQMFPLPQDELNKALDLEADRVAAEVGGDRQVALAYLSVMPLLWERKAISRFLTENASLIQALPPIETVPEAVNAASMDRPLTSTQQNRLATLLQVLPE